MLDEYSDYYSEASQLFSKYGSTLADVSFNGRRQALEVYCLTAISLCESHAKAVSLLLKNDCAVEPIIVMRGVFEIFCDFCWISQAGSVDEHNERVFRLEANPYREFAKEVRLIEEDINGASRGSTLYNLHETHWVQISRFWNRPSTFASPRHFSISVLSHHRSRHDGLQWRLSFQPLSPGPPPRSAHLPFVHPVRPALKLRCMG